MNAQADRYREALGRAELSTRVGHLVGFNGLVVEAQGPDARVGEICAIETRDMCRPLLAEVVGFRKGRVLLMPEGPMQGVSAEATVRATGRYRQVPVGHALLGRVVDAFGAPLDDRGPVRCERLYPIQRAPINPLARGEITEVLETGVRAIDALLTLGKGQRVGVFAGSGVGKSTLLGMLARHVRVDVIVVAMIGERGREVGDFLEHALGPEGHARSVVMVATADQPALVRTHAVHAAHAIAEYFRDQQLDVLLILDSITRFAMAQREISLAVGEPPTSRGYPPSVFSLLPQILERGGSLRAGGSISSIYSVLVEGDDMNEPVADHMRAILDGHVVLSRDLAARGQFPAIDPLHSVSRLRPRLIGPVDEALVRRLQALLAVYEGSHDLVEMGAYQSGSHPELDTALALMPSLKALWAQRPEERTPRADVMRTLHTLLEPASEAA